MSKDAKPGTFPLYVGGKGNATAAGGGEARRLREVDAGDADGSEAGEIEDVAAVEVVELAVGNEVEVASDESAGGGEGREGGAIFENVNARDASGVPREGELGDAGRADTVLDRDEFRVPPIEAIDAGESVARAGVEFDGVAGRGIEAKETELIGEEESGFVGGDSDSVGKEQFARESERGEGTGLAVEAENLIAKGVGEIDIAVAEDDEVVEGVFARAGRGKASEERAVRGEVEEFGLAFIGRRGGPDGVVSGIEPDAENREERRAGRSGEAGGFAAGGAGLGELDDFPEVETAHEERVAGSVEGKALGDEVFVLGLKGDARLSDDGEVLVRVLDKLLVLTRVVEDGESGFALRVKAFLGGDAFAEIGEGGGEFLELRVRGGEEEEDGGAVGSLPEQPRGDGHVGLNFGFVGGVLRDGGKRTEECECEEREERGADGTRSHQFPLNQAREPRSPCDWSQPRSVAGSTRPIAKSGAPESGEVQRQTEAPSRPERRQAARVRSRE